MLQTGSSPPRLDGLVVLVVDATTGIGRELATRLSAAGAVVAVVGAGHPDRGDDAATNAAFLCKALDDAGLTALPYRIDIRDPAEAGRLPAQIADDAGPVNAAVVVLPPPDADGELSHAFHAVSAALAAALPPGARHIERTPAAAAGPDTATAEDRSWLRSVVDGLAADAARATSR
ncbi:SDR family oxidoreductase [Streptomyces sp. NBC_00250]|uniref:SDR family NAD(P)-dependent oxidoreductase n=1 Tax=Streptomyces sp. NBC_00250 TaxID=2903641 RepID=UPI002E27B010|nr:SDR family NAD(P)-dependent oxidoreductase [Streptomyces sp. NBC_00250]